MSTGFVVEADHQIVGVGVRVAGGYQFFASTPALKSLEGKVFPRARIMQHEVTEAARKLKLSVEPVR